MDEEEQTEGMDRKAVGRSSIISVAQVHYLRLSHVSWMLCPCGSSYLKDLLLMENILII